MKLKSIKTAIKEETQYLNDIKSGKIVPIKTNYNFINQAMLNGLHESDVITIAGASGGGKTTFIGELQEGICRLNKNIRILDFTFEYLARKKVSRMAAKKYGYTMKEIYKKSSEIPDYSYLSNYPIHFVENPLSMGGIRHCIEKYCEKFSNDRVIVCIDHSLLVKRRKGDSERENLVHISDTLNEIKKDYPITVFIVSQLNDNIEEISRKVKPAMQYPKKKDIFGGRALYHVSDLVVVLVDPIKLNLPTKAYGKYNLPFAYKPSKQAFPHDVVYAHIIKARDGKSTISPLWNNLKNYSLTEFNKEDLKKFYSKYGGN